MDGAVSRLFCSTRTLVLPLFLAACGWVFGPQELQAAPPCGVVFVANGAGDFRCTTKQLEEALLACDVPLRVETVFWSHGHARIFADQVDQPHARHQGQLLACQVAALRQECPDTPIYFLGHCAGCAVLLAAAEELPPETVDRIILLAPSVPACYDLSAALASTRDGIDSFYSDKDTICLGWGIRVAVLFGGHCKPPAGRVGFCPPPTSADCAACYAKLRQYPWEPGLECTGHKGGHYGGYQQGFLRAFVLPLMTPACPAPTLANVP
jgi:hypothetical protein